MSMMERVGLYLRRVQAPYEAVCARQWIVCPGEQTRVKPAIHMPGELDRVLGVPPDTTLTHEWARVRGGVCSHRATKAYVLKNAEIRMGYVCKGPVKWKLADSCETASERMPVERHRRLALGCTLTANRYFCHWLTDGLALQLLATGTAPVATTGGVNTSHKQQYAKIFGLPANPVSRARVEELTVFDDVGQNSGKRERFGKLRRLARSAVDGAAADSAGPPVGVMLLRGTTGQRRVLVNEQRVAEHLARRGFAIIDPERTSAGEILRQALDTRIVIGVEGSQLVHGLLPLAEGGAILALQPPARFNNVYKDYADAMGMWYGFTVGTPDAGGFRVNIDDLDRLLDEASTRVAV